MKPEGVCAGPTPGNTQPCVISCESGYNIRTSACLYPVYGYPRLPRILSYPFVSSHIRSCSGSPIQSPISTPTQPLPYPRMYRTAVYILSLSKFCNVHPCFASLAHVHTFTHKYPNTPMSSHSHSNILKNTSIYSCPPAPTPIHWHPSINIHSISTMTHETLPNTHTHP